MIALWLISLAVAFHFGWWGRHRLTQKIKADAVKNINDARALNASPSVIAKIQKAYWDML